MFIHCTFIHKRSKIFFIFAPAPPPPIKSSIPLGRRACAAEMGAEGGMALSSLPCRIGTVTTPTRRITTTREVHTAHRLRGLFQGPTHATELSAVWSARSVGVNHGVVPVPLGAWGWENLWVVRSVLVFRLSVADKGLQPIPAWSRVGELGCLVQLREEPPAKPEHVETPLVRKGK